MLPAGVANIWLPVSIKELPLKDRAEQSRQQRQSLGVLLAFLQHQAYIELLIVEHWHNSQRLPHTYVIACHGTMILALQPIIQILDCGVCTESRLLQVSM